MGADAALKGLRAARLWPVARNDKGAYELGAEIPLPGAVSLAIRPKRAERELIIDDEAAERSLEYIYDELTLTLGGLAPDVEAALRGETRELALGYECLTNAGTYRSYRYLAVRLVSVEAAFGKNPGGAVRLDYRLVFRAGARKRDGAAVLVE